MFSFRPFKKIDTALVVSWVETPEEYFNWCAGQIGSYPFLSEMLSSYSDNIADDSGVFLMVACEDDKPYGFLQFSYPTNDRDIIKFEYVLIDPKFRGKGYGKRMVNFAIKYAFDFLSARKITVEIFEDDPVPFRAYTSVGFSLTKSVHSFEIMGKMRVVNEMVMYSPNAKNLSQENDKSGEKKIADIIKANSFRYAFQPIVSAVTGEIYAYEALMRAEYEGTTVPPVEVIEYASKHKKLYDIEKATFFNVFEEYEKREEEFRGRKIFVNSIPGYQLTDADYSEFASRYKKHFGRALFEITEMTELKNTELKILLERSKEDGFGLAIDDYGTGYSNTSSLLTYLPDCVKLDRLLISNINEDTKKQHFVKGIAEFAHSNGFYVLAEGVETSAELSTVINIGVDLIQGFYTARPSFDILEEIDSDVRNEIINENTRNQTSDTRKIYVVNDEAELPLMRLSLNQYTGILIARSEFKLVGNTKYCADMSIKIKDGIKCRLTIKDVFLESVMQLPCIELGNKSELTLVLEGENHFRKLGILVPKDSKLTFEGDGNLVFRVQGIRSYGIGNDFEGTFGNISWKGTGALDILVEADSGIGIGGGKASENSYIGLLSGTVRTEAACGNSVSVGCVYDTVPIEISDSNVKLELKTDNGIGIGCQNDKQNVTVKNSNLNIICAGSIISAIGSNSDTSSDGTIDIVNSDLTVSANGQKLALLGGMNGSPDISIADSSIYLKGEGNEVVALGTKDSKSVIKAANCSLEIKVSSGIPIPIGATEENVTFNNVTKNFKINE